MKERPILFSGAMVRAILAGTKTQTRRVVNHERFWVEADDEYKTPLHVHRNPRHSNCDGCGFDLDSGVAYHSSPYGKKGDRLWVRETWRPWLSGYSCGVSFLAGHDDKHLTHNDAETLMDLVKRTGGFLEKPMNAVHRETWRPSIHMPRWASRITLEVTAVRVEPLSALTEADAVAEGALTVAGADIYPSAVSAFIALWNSINGKRAPWSSAPWVWVVEWAPVKL